MVAGRTVGTLSRSLLAASSRLVELLARTIGSWAWLGVLLVWGTLYLSANLLTRGGIDWLLGWRWRWLAWATFAADAAPAADVWHAHDLTSLPAAHEARRRHGGMVVYDSHEIYLESGRHAGQPRWAKRMLGNLERELAQSADAILTVNDSLRQELTRRLGVAEVAVLHNCPPLHVGSRRGTSKLRRRIGVGPDAAVLIYHGSLAAHRGIEQLLDAITRPALAAAHLVFLGSGPHLPTLIREATRDRYGGRLHVLEGVAPSELLGWLDGADVAVAPIQPSTTNHYFSSPNKVFEAIAVGIPVAGSDFPEFRRVVTDSSYGALGVLFDPTRPSEIAASIAALLSLGPREREALRNRCRRASLERWNWELEGRELVGLYGRLLSSSQPDPPAHAMSARAVNA